MFQFTMEGKPQGQAAVVVGVSACSPSLLVLAEQEAEREMLELSQLSPQPSPMQPITPDPGMMLATFRIDLWFGFACFRFFFFFFFPRQSLTL